MPRELKDSGIEWIGQIPKNWKVERHKNVMHKDKRICESYNGEDIISLTMNGVIVRDLDAGGKMPTSFDGYQYVEPGDLLLCLFDIDVTPRCVGLVNNYGITSPAYSRFKLHDGYLNKYYDYLLREIDDTKALLHLAKNLRSSFTEEDFGAIHTIVPPYHEQIKIASFLDRKCNEINEILHSTEQSIAEYEKLRQSIITEAVTIGVRNKDRQQNDSGVEWIGSIPADWHMIRMKDCAEKRTSGAWGEDAKNNQNDIVCIRIADFDYDRLVFSKDHGYTIRNYDTATINRLKLSDGDILIEKSGGGEKTPVGRAVVFDLGIDALYANFMDKIVCKKEFNPRWFAYVFAAFYQNGFTKNYIKQTTGIQNLDLTAMLSSEKIPVPTKEEQNKIVEILDVKCAEINDLIDEKKNFMKNLIDYRKSIIYEYTTGKKEVPEL